MDAVAELALAEEFCAADACAADACAADACAADTLAPELINACAADAKVTFPVIDQGCEGGRFACIPHFHASSPSIVCRCSDVKVSG